MKDSNCAEITYNDDDGGKNFRIVRSVTAGTYYIAVRHYYSTSKGVGAYTLYVSFTTNPTKFLSFPVQGKEPYSPAFITSVLDHDVPHDLTKEIDFYNSKNNPNNLGPFGFNGTVLSFSGELFSAGISDPYKQGASDAVLCTDGSRSLKGAAHQIGIAHRALNLSKGVRVLAGVYHLQNVNAYDSRLKNWIRQWDGLLPPIGISVPD